MFLTHSPHIRLVQTSRAGQVITMSVLQLETGIRLYEVPWSGGPYGAGPTGELVDALNIRKVASGHRRSHAASTAKDCTCVDTFNRKVLVVPRSTRWREAVSTALLGDWDEPLWQTGYLPPTAIGALRAEARALHRQLVPLWRRKTRHGRILSLDAALSDGLSLYDLVTADVDLLAHTAGGVFEDERLNRILRGLHPAERAVVFALAEGEGTTWTEAAAVTGATDPKAFGERVRRKTKRHAAEQHRRTRQAHRPRPATGPAA
ncbi:hypothetical protein M2164_000077 [Streptomyces sp. SAI-208]|uniref:hypothetical protein n=1 Tax=Streptomyces sp. SAI-208 TaxID=2940550 RepID=UPI00247362AA|nr:hypothetical protein [Streptomyces sp. SAI-208]MDH6604442.1 hypothetical protein [Streptomyces sp. SAI-208]